MWEVGGKVESGGAREGIPLGYFEVTEWHWGPQDIEKQGRIQISTTVNSEPNCVGGARDRGPKGDVHLLCGGDDRDQVVEGSVGCSKEPKLNLTSEPSPFLVPKIRLSLAEQRPCLDNVSITYCTGPP